MNRKLLGPMVVPWDDAGDLASAYQEALEIFRGHYVWLGFLDCDVEIMARDYVSQTRVAIKNHPTAGLITCRVNRQHKGNKSQSLGLDVDLDTAGRMAVQQRLRSRFFNRSRELSAGAKDLISGFWFFIHIERALEARAFDHEQPAFFGVDQVAHERLAAAGYPAVVLDGVFVWHRYYHLESRGNRGHLGRVVPKERRR